MKIRITNLSFDLEIDGVPVVVTDPPPPPPPPPPPDDLPAGYATDAGVARWMFFHAMTSYGLDPITVQGHGDWIVAALKAAYPALDVYVSTKDAPVWPGLGSFDATIDSGKGGWSFRLDHDTAWQPPGLR
jgi:hypothetical protein